MLQKSVYPNEYMDDLEIFNEILLSKKRRFLQSFRHGRCWCRLLSLKESSQDFKIENLGEYYDLHIEIYELYPACFLTALGLAW